MSLEEVVAKISKSATQFSTGGFQPKNTIEESWIGKVFAFGKEEGIPADASGAMMVPLAQLYLPNLPYVPQGLEGITLLTVFISKDFPDAFEDMGANWLIRTYTNTDEFEIQHIENPDSWLNPFPLDAQFIEKDAPVWDGGGLSPEMENVVLDLENDGVIGSYYDIAAHTYDHKVGGYPSFCQPGIDFGEGYEFVFQIASDEKANLEVIDNGSFMFARNAQTGDWRLYYDFF